MTRSKILLSTVLVMVVVTAALWTLTRLNTRTNALAFIVPPGTIVVPYTAVLSEMRTFPDGTVTPGPTHVYALRSDGAMLSLMDDGTNTNRHIRRPDGFEIEVRDQLRSKTTVRSTVTESWILDPRDNCTHSVSRSADSVPRAVVAHELVAGYRAVRLTSKGSTRWYAVDYGCAPVGRITALFAGGSIRFELISLVKGEPSDTYFDVPHEYQESPRSSAYTKRSGLSRRMN